LPCAVCFIASLVRRGGWRRSSVERAFYKPLLDFDPNT
jgi:hypothetical protein